MAQRRKIILLSAVCGAVVGALAVTFGSHIPASVPALAYDQALLAHRRYYSEPGIEDPRSMSQ